MNYLKSVRNELKNITWPSVADINRFTWISIIFILIFALYFALTDEIFSNVIDWFISL